MKDQQVPLWALLATALAAAVFPLVTGIVNNQYQLAIADRKLRNDHSAILAADKREIYKRVSAWLIETETFLRRFEPRPGLDASSSVGKTTAFGRWIGERADRQDFDRLYVLSSSSSQLLGEVGLYSRNIALLINEYVDCYEALLVRWWPQSNLETDMSALPAAVLRDRMTDYRLQILVAMGNEIQQVSRVRE